MEKVKNILLIDDDPVTNMINTKLITKNFGFNVNAYTNARETLKQLIQWAASDSNHFPDVIFLDINMPVMDGWEFLSEFQKLPDLVLNRCHVFMLTSSIDIEDIEKSRSYKTVNDFVSKPLTPDKLKMLLNPIVSRN